LDASSIYGETAEIAQLLRVGECWQDSACLPVRAPADQHAMANQQRNPHLQYHQRQPPRPQVGTAILRRLRDGARQCSLSCMTHLGA
jgi:hypothetical protein